MAQSARKFNSFPFVIKIRIGEVSPRRERTLLYCLSAPCSKLDLKRSFQLQGEKSSTRMTLEVLDWKFAASFKRPNGALSNSPVNSSFLSRCRTADVTLNVGVRNLWCGAALSALGVVSVITKLFRRNTSKASKRVFREICVNQTFFSWFRSLPTSFPTFPYWDVKRLSISYLSRLFINHIRWKPQKCLLRLIKTWETLGPVGTFPLRVGKV